MAANWDVRRVFNGKGSWFVKRRVHANPGNLSGYGHAQILRSNQEELFTEISKNIRLNFS